MGVGCRRLLFVKAVLQLLCPLSCLLSYDGTSVEPWIRAHNGGKLKAPAVHKAVLRSPYPFSYVLGVGTTFVVGGVYLAAA